MNPILREVHDAVSGTGKYRAVVLHDVVYGTGGEISVFRAGASEPHVKLQYKTPSPLWFWADSHSRGEFLFCAKDNTSAVVLDVTTGKSHMLPLASSIECLEYSEECEKFLALSHGFWTLFDFSNPRSDRLWAYAQNFRGAPGTCRFVFGGRMAVDTSERTCYYNIQGEFFEFGR